MNAKRDSMSDKSPLPSPPRDSRPLLLIIGGVVMAVVLLLVMSNIDQSTGSVADEEQRLVDLDIIAVPTTPTEAEVASASKGLDRESMASLRDGAWIQIADEEGRLAQEYSARRLDPMPDQWVEMDAPQAIMYPSSGRVIVMEADQGTAHIPARALEAGILNGGVKIRIYEPGSSSSDVVDITTARPSVSIDAEVAEFDNIQGQITSERLVRIRTDEIDFAGEGLSIQLSEDGRQIERLIVDRATRPIRITRGALGSKSNVSDSSADSRATPTPASKSSVTAQSDSVVEVESVPWYRLVLYDDVTIERIEGKESERSEVRGDRLVATFTLGEGGIDANLASSPADEAGEVFFGPALPPATFIATSALAASGAQESDDESENVIFVNFSGRLVMSPDPTAQSRMDGSGDAEIKVIGLEGRGVQVIDDGSDARVKCAVLNYRASRDRIELIGDEDHPLVVTSPRMTLSGDRFWLQRTTSRGGLIGPGSMMLLRGADSFEAALDGIPAAVGRSLVDAHPNSHAVMVAALHATGTAQSAQEDIPNLEILWQEGIDLDFDEAEDAERIKQARFKGDVAVRSREFNLQSETLAVNFSLTGDRRDAIERIVAEGSATVDRIGEEGSLAAERIDLSLAESPDGRTVPTVMKATGGVEARDPGQTMWTETLMVTFEPREEGDETPENPGGFGEQDMGSVQVTSVNATEKIQVRLKQGARVFADRLEGDALRRNLLLAGEDVMVIQENVIADRMREVRFNDSEKTVRGSGPGRFRYYDSVVTPEGTGKIERPKPAERPALDATWSQSLSYNDAENSGGGRLELEGTVRVRSETDPKETGRLDSRRLILDLEKSSDGSETSDSGTSSDLEGLPDGGSRQLRKMTAIGDAILESQAWDTKERVGDPRLFRVTGERVEYEPISREALVKGKGSLLVNDPRPRTNPTVNGEESPRVGFGIDGTSRFRWSKQMTMRNEVDDRFLITMEGDIEVLHAGLAAEDTLSLTGERLEVTVERPRPDRTQDEPADEAQTDKESAPESLDGDEDPKKANTTQDTQKDSLGVDLGGPAELIRVRGLGRVFIRTPEQDVECEEFDYDVETQIALLRARSGRVVTIQPRNSAQPIRAELVQWDLRTGRIRILSGQGEISR